MYIADPARALRALVRHLKPDGIVAFQEIVLSLVCSVPPLPLVGRVAQWVNTAFERAGAELDMGLKLDATMRAAGLPTLECYAAARLVAAADSAGYAVFAAVVGALLPAIEKFGIATAAEVDIDALAQRLRDETVAANACWLSHAGRRLGANRSLKGSLAPPPAIPARRPMPVSTPTTPGTGSLAGPESVKDTRHPGQLAKVSTGDAAEDL